MLCHTALLLTFTTVKMGMAAVPIASATADIKGDGQGSREERRTGISCPPGFMSVTVCSPYLKNSGPVTRPEHARSLYLCACGDTDMLSWAEALLRHRRKHRAAGG